MAKFKVNAVYQVSEDEDIYGEKEMEVVEKQRWQIFKERFGVKLVELKVGKMPD